MAVKKLISSPSSASSSSSSSSDSSFKRFVAQRTPSLKCKQHDSEGEEKESEDSSSSEDDNDSSSDEERFVAQPSPSLKRKQQYSKEEEEKESEEDEEKTKSPATKSVSHPSQAHQSCTEQDKIKESVPHPSQQSSNQEEEEEDAKSPVENSESLVQSEKKLKPNFVPAKKQISSPSASSSSDDANDSSSDEEQFVAQPVPSLKRKQHNSKEREEKESEGDSSDEEEDEEKDKSPVRKCVSHLSQTQQSCTEEEKQKENTKKSVPHLSQQSSSSEEEEEEDAKLLVENSESLVQPQKKKLKPNSVPAGKSPSTATNSAVQRIWSVEDELVLLHALSHHHNTYGKVPSSKEYGSFLTTIIGSLTFLATEKQLGNKIRTWKTNYAQRKKMGSKPKPLNPHEIEVFKICAKLFEDVKNTKLVGGVAKGNSTIYLREVISRQKLPTWLSTVEDMVQQLGESRARDLEAKAKQLSIDEMKLNAREVKLMADLFDFIADGMAGDG